MDKVDKYLLDEKFMQSSLTLMNLVFRFLDSQKIDHFIAQGTLLGYKKYKSIMPWDADIDVNAIADKSKLDTAELREFVAKNNLEYFWIKEDLVLKIKYKNQAFPTCDICPFKKQGDRYCVNRYCNEVPPPRWVMGNVSAEYIYPISRAKMNGVDVGVPHKMDAMLNTLYSGYQDKILLDLPQSYGLEKNLLITKDMTEFHYLTGIAIGMSRYYLIKS